MIRLRPNKADPLWCPNCRASAFALFTGARGDNGAHPVVKAECVTCGTELTLEVAQPEPPRIHVDVRPAALDPAALKTLVASGDTPNKALLRAGRRAFLRGESPEANPHPPGSHEHQIWNDGHAGMQAAVSGFPKGTMCHAGSDGECNWPECPQNRDGEPMLSGRHCPLDLHEHHEER
jgi:hypothetical protein